MGLQAGGRRRAAVPSGAAKLLHPEYVALLWRDGEGIQLSPPHADPWVIPLGRAGGTTRELVRSSSEILADESSLAVASARHAVRRYPQGAGSRVHCQERLLVLGRAGGHSPPRMRKAGSGPLDYSSQRNAPLAAGAEPLAPS